MEPDQKKGCYVMLWCDHHWLIVCTAFNTGYIYVLPNKGHNAWGKKIRDFKKGEEKYQKCFIYQQLFFNEYTLLFFFLFLGNCILIKRIKMF